jgi:hypothetical protein
VEGETDETTQQGERQDDHHYDARDFALNGQRGDTSRITRSNGHHNPPPLYALASWPPRWWCHLEVVSETLVHRSIRITKDPYSHLFGAQRKHAADAMDAVLWGSCR